MKTIAVYCLMIGVVFSSSLYAAPASEPNEPWVSLFNGKDFTGWKIIGGRGKAWIQDGAITCHQVSNTVEHAFVCTEKKYGDFILEADAKIEGQLHTGFLFRCIDTDPETAKVCLYGYQVKIDPTPRRWTGGIFDDYGDRWEWYYPLEKSETARQAFKMNEWNHFRIEAIGNRLKVWVNGVPTTNLIHDKYDNGYIALKIHWMKDDPDREKVFMYYRNINIIDKKPSDYVKDMDYPVIDMTQAAAAEN
ncbi:DUF1080 domain-containing protein [Planctomycetota bacterium]